MAGDFVHLHVHSEYSLLDGLGRIKDLVARAVELKMPALALTDHGTMHGAIEFYRRCKDAGINPIIGVEAYLTAPGRRMWDRDPNLDRTRSHLLLLAYNQTGYQNLLTICSASQLEGFYYRPRIDSEFLAAHAEGLICTTGCGAAEIPRLLSNGAEEAAAKRLEWYRDVFGPERFYLELQEHSLPWLSEINRKLVEWHKKYELSLLATNDVHYVHAEDADPHDVLLCIQTSALVSQEDRMRMSDGSYYLKSYEEMFALFGELPGALSNSLRIAEMCAIDLDTKEYHIPQFPVPEGYDAASYLRHLCEHGLRERYGARADEERVQKRLDYELSVIHQMGFDNYFLIVWDLCQFARNRDIWWNVRGSGAGSVVAYTLGITNLDPLHHNLIFERFLNPGRVSMPDIDLDYPDDRREEMINYVVDRYGRENVAQIITFGTMQARAAIRDVGRALDIPLSEVDRVAKLIPAIPGKPVSIREALENIVELRDLYESEDYVRQLVDTATKLEGVTRHASTHAAGVIIADKPLVNYTPLFRPTHEGGTHAVTQFDMEICESIGLLKVDFLGLSTLTIMRRAAQLIEDRHKIRYDLSNIPLDDPLSYELLSSGEVTGVFQVESAGMRRVLTEMRPTEFDHIVATISLYRPGPMEYIPTYIRRMHGDEPVVYRHPALEPILRETYGIIVYQEQIIRIASELAGYAPGDADMIRKAVGKKKKEELLKHREQFIAGATERGISQEAAESIYDDIEYFARYGFNKAHAADYAIITVQTAYLKAHYPVEYMTALLSVELDNMEKVALFITECRRMGIEVLPPDINRSELDFVIEQVPPEERVVRPTTPMAFDFKVEPGAAIRFGLAAVKNVGVGPVNTILTARREGGPFTSLEDFCQRVDLRQVNRRALECLIKVGAFDAFGKRAQLLEIVDRMVGLSASHHHAQAVGQMTMFDLMGGDANVAPDMLSPLPDVEEATARERLGWEKDLLGVYVSAHPLQQMTIDLSDVITTFCGSVDESLAGQTVVLAGMIVDVRTIVTKKGDPMAFVRLEDLQGQCEITVFPRTFQDNRDLWMNDQIVIIKGQVEMRNGRVNVICNEVRDYVERHQGVDDDLCAMTSSTPWSPIAHLGASVLAESGISDYDSVPPLPDEENPFDNEPPDWETVTPAVADGFSHLPAVRHGESADHKANGKTTDGAPPAITEDSPRRLYVTLRCGNDLEADRTRLRRVVETMRSYRGRDRFYLKIEGRSSPVQVEFPNDGTRICPELERSLSEILGKDAVRVE